MSTSVEFDKEKLANLNRCMTELGDPKLVTAAFFVGGLTVKRIMSEYPPESHRTQPFKSDKQRRYVFWAIKQGLIEIPYRRGQSPGSQDMKHRWAVESVPSGVEIRNNASYAPLVHGWNTQANYHKVTGWKTDKDTLEQNREKIFSDILTAFVIAVNHIINK